MAPHKDKNIPRLNLGMFLQRHPNLYITILEMSLFTA